MKTIETCSALLQAGKTLSRRRWWASLLRNELLKSSVKLYLGGSSDGFDGHVSEAHAEQLLFLRNHFIAWYGVIQNQRGWEMVTAYGNRKNFLLPSTPGDCLDILIHLFFETRFCKTKESPWLEMIAIARGGCRKKDRALIAALARFDASERELLEILASSSSKAKDSAPIQS